MPQNRWLGQHCHNGIAATVLPLTDSINNTSQYPTAEDKCWREWVCLKKNQDIESPMRLRITRLTKQWKVF